MTRKTVLIALLILLCSPTARAQFASGRECFCIVGEAVEGCSCRSTDSIDKFNNERAFPILKKLLERDFFKFYKVNMEKPCPFWSDDRQCSSKECSIGYCDDEVPAGLREPHITSNVKSVLSKGRDSSESRKLCDSSNQFDPIDTSMSEQDIAQLRDIDIFEDNANQFCDIDDEFSSDMHYVNLQKNPERYTGYKGDSALKVWRSIYQENCFKPDPRFDKNFLLHPTTSGLCLEKRVFYRLISGLHSAITVSIASHNYKPAPGGLGEGTWVRNVEMFHGRFGTKWSQEGPERLRNLYFVYMLEMKALVKAATYIQNELFYTGNDTEDQRTKESVDEFIQLLKSYPDQFDETQLFTGVESHARCLREEFRQKFMNISRIMDCVGCDKCRLWGKVQVHGMGTALKILFSEFPQTATNMIAMPFRLARNEVVAMFQSFGRYASSIWEVEQFRRELAPAEL